MPFDIPILVLATMKQINKYFKFSVYAKYVVKICVVGGTCSHTNNNFFKRSKMSNISIIQSLMGVLLAANYIRSIYLQFEVNLKVFKCHLELRSFAWSTQIHSVGRPMFISTQSQFITTKHTATQPNTGQSSRS